MDKADLVGGIALFVFGVAMIFVGIPYGTTDGQFFGLSPTFFPTVIAVGLTLCAAALTAQAFVRVRAGGTGEPMPMRLWNIAMFILAALLTLGGVILIDVFGILVGGPPLVAALMVFLGERNIIRIVLTAGLCVATVYVLALYVLHTPLPS